MIESEKYSLNITFKSSRKLELEVTGTDLDWLFDFCFGRRNGNFLNFENEVININEIEYFTYEKIQENKNEMA
jgi:hypothetical protein